MRCAWAGSRSTRSSIATRSNLSASGQERGDYEEEITEWVVEQLKHRRLRFAVEDPDNAGKLATRLAHLAGQRPPVERQGA